MNDRIIGFAGRLRSGKTELAKICEEFGYERLYFAKPLKKLVADLIYGTIDDVNNLKTGNEDGTWVKEMRSNDIIFLSQETNIPIKTVSNLLKNHVFHNTRDMLQIIGTDLIRAYNPNWHVDKIKEMIEDDKKYVFEDIRFTNERKCIEDLGGTIWFVVRPNIDSISHHISEETLKWQDFTNVIINNYSLEYLQLRWRIFMENGYEKSLHLRDRQLFQLFNNVEYKEHFLKSTDPFNPLHFLLISKDFFTYSTIYRNNTNIAKIREYEPNKVLVEWNSNKLDNNIVSNTLEIEDLKFYIN